MAEPLAKRIARLLAATAEAAADRADIAGNENRLRETIRDLDHAIDAAQAEHDIVVTSRLNAARQQKLLHTRAAELAEIASQALGENRAGLAEAARRRHADCQTESARLDRIMAAAHASQTRLAENLAALIARQNEMAQALAASLKPRDGTPPAARTPARARSPLEPRRHRASQPAERPLPGAAVTAVAQVDAAATAAQAATAAARLTTQAANPN